MLRQQLTDILLDYLDRPMQLERRRERLQRIARLACDLFPGDLCEIGAHVGKTTIKLLEVAQEFNRRVLVVDPWLKGTQNCKGGERAQFDKRTEPLKHLLDVIPCASRDAEAIRGTMRPLAFALVDGLHTYDACYGDILTVLHAGIICVDDILQMHDVRLAFLDAKRDTAREAVQMVDTGFREGYLI